MLIILYWSTMFIWLIHSQTYLFIFELMLTFPPVEYFFATLLSFQQVHTHPVSTTPRSTARMPTTAPIASITLEHSPSDSSNTSAGSATSVLACDEKLEAYKLYGRV